MVNGDEEVIPATALQFMCSILGTGGGGREGRIEEDLESILG